jgi:hypothetical protein
VFVSLLVVPVAERVVMKAVWLLVVPVAERVVMKAVCLFFTLKEGFHWQLTVETNVDVNQTRQHKDVFREAWTQNPQYSCQLKLPTKLQTRLSVQNFLFACNMCCFPIRSISEQSSRFYLDCG